MSYITVGDAATDARRDAAAAQAEVAAQSASAQAKAKAAYEEARRLAAGGAPKKKPPPGAPVPAPGAPAPQEAGMFGGLFSNPLVIAGGVFAALLIVTKLRRKAS